MRTGRARPRSPAAAAAARRELQAAAKRKGQSWYVPPSKLPPKPEWLKLGVQVAILKPRADNPRCATGVVASVYEIRPTEDGYTWEVACSLRGKSLGRYRLRDPQEVVLWEAKG